MSQEQRRQAEFIVPANIIKAKVGDGGLSEYVLKRAQSMIDNNTTDFKPIAENFLDSIAETLKQAESHDNLSDLPADQHEVLLNTILYPSLELKSHGSMFKYPMISRAAGDLVRFLEFVKELNFETIDVIKAYHKIMSMVAMGALPREETEQGNQLCVELNHACTRYFEKHHKD